MSECVGKGRYHRILYIEDITVEPNRSAERPSMKIAAQANDPLRAPNRNAGEHKKNLALMLEEC